MCGNVFGAAAYRLLQEPELLEKATTGFAAEGMQFNGDTLASAKPAVQRFRGQARRFLTGEREDEFYG